MYVGTIPRVQIPHHLTHRLGRGSGIRPRPAVGLALGLLAALLPGCGLVHDNGTKAVTMRITRDFGVRRVGEVRQAHVTGSDTLLSFLRRRFPVRTAGNTVTSIRGVSAKPGSSWFLFINGSASGIGTPKLRTLVRPGERIWWDLHDDTASRNVPVVVGSFPEPFVHGVGGKRLPVTLECSVDVAAGCDRVAVALAAVGVPAARQLLGTGSGTNSLVIAVATWKELRGEIAGLLIAHGPATGGVYARFAGRDGQTLELLNARGQVARRLGAGAGLVAGTGNPKTAPTWFVTGTDAAGVAAAASALTPARLAYHLAVAVQGTQDLPVPQP
ncbi:MAG: DUF4430 domain-containing protein [Actinomycetota bacterium]|nr:DUF4430 domain-containing protein [Actinomycetota bacterium]